jgi:hypothetical protein
MERNQLNERERFLKKVWPRIEEFYNRFGPANYEGFIAGDEQGWFGPYVWSENGDAVRIITKFCEDEFGFLNVHNESKIDKFVYENFEKDEKWKSIDIDVTDASMCDNSYEFRKLRHGLFIEVKEILKGGMFKDHERKIDGFMYDCKKLQEQIDKGRCKYAIAILIDDGYLNGEPYVKDTGNLIIKLNEDSPDVKLIIWQKKR